VEGEVKVEGLQSLVEVKVERAMRERDEARLYVQIRFEPALLKARLAS